MAPCGCFFDPRIYHIEWITNDVPHASVYKLLEVPRVQSVQSTSLPGIQRYVRDPGQSTTYAHYQQALKNSQNILSHYNQEDPTNLTKQDNTTDPLQETPQGRILNPQEHGLVQQNETQLPELVITVPILKQDETILPSGAYSCLNERFPPRDPIRRPSVDQSHQEFHRYDSSQGKETKSTKNYQVADLVLVSKVLNIHNGNEQAPLSNPTDSRDYFEPTDPQQSLLNLPEESHVVNTPTSHGLPEEVLLEDAMKMFDCIPGNTEFSVFNDDSSSDRAQCKDAADELQLLHSDVLIAGGPSTCKDPVSDISVLNLPDELLSADYSVPEIAEALHSMDYFYNVKDFNVQPPWDVGLDSDLVENLSQQLPSQNLPCVKTTNTSLIEATSPQRCGGLNNTTSPQIYHMDIQECLEEMVDY